MIAKRSFFLLLLSIAVILISGFSEERAYFTFQKSIAFKAREIYSDHIGNYYLVTRDKVQKVNLTDSLTQFHQRQNIGAITTVDVSNPMKTIIYYRDYRKVEILDTWMSMIREIDLDEYGYMQVSAVCGSSTNGIWLYDENTAQLNRITDGGDLILQSVSTRQSMNKVLHVSYLLEKNAKVYVSDPEVGIVQFDMFGSYIKTLPLKGVKKFSIFSDQIVFFDQGKIYNYNPLTLETKELILPDTKVIDATLLKNKLVAIDNDSVRIYSFK
jgi:hypothetical protein